MKPPYLTPRARDMMPDMSDKIGTLLEKWCAGGASKGDVYAADQHANGNAQTFAAKLLGAAVSPKIDVQDSAYIDTYRALEAGMSGQERQFMDRQTPALRKIVGLMYRVNTAGMAALGDPEVRAFAFAHFFNGRNEEGMEGHHLHIGVRKVFERLFELFSGASAVANRMGFYRAGNLFELAYDTSGMMRELSPNEPGEAFPVAANRSKMR